jgi:AcrR family transcriptional regulator
MDDTAASPPQGPGRDGAPGYARGRARKRQILDVALDVFGESGYGAASLRDLARRAGISHAGLLHHFPSKEQLLAAALEHRDELDGARLAGDPTDPWDVLDGLVSVVEHNARVPGLVELFCVLSAEATSPQHPAHGYFVRRYDRLVARVEAALQGLADDGRLPAGQEPRSLAVRTVALVDGLQVQWLLSGRSLDMAAELRAHLDRHLGARPGAGSGAARHR